VSEHSLPHDRKVALSLLRSIEDNWSLGSLRRNDATARPYWFVR
jgi:hypothetical protein